jgi:hypothetical protein
MKIISRILASLILFSAVAFAQTLVQGTSQGSTITASSGVLSISDSGITAVVINGNQTTGSLGNLSLTTGSLVSGDFSGNAVLDAGGEVIIDAPGYLDYVGNFAAGTTWSEFTLANGNHYYELSGGLTSTEGNGAIVCDTDTLAKGKTFNKSANLASCSFSATLN